MSDTTGLTELTSLGIVVYSAQDTWVTRQLIGSPGITINNPDGSLGNPTLSLAPNLISLLNLQNTPGIVLAGANNSFAATALVGPSSGLDILNPNGVGGPITFALTDDLAGLEALTTVGIAIRLGDGEYTTQKIVTNPANLTISSADGTAGPITLNLAAPPNLIPGTYGGLVIDAYGRITQILRYTTLSGLGITDGVPLTGAVMTGLLTLSADPTTALGAATKQYVDTNFYKSRCKASVSCVINVNISIAAPSSSYDNVTFVPGMRLLLISQSDGTANNIYIYNGPGNTLTLASDVNTSYEISCGMFIWCEQGTLHAETEWTCTTFDPIVLGISVLQFYQTGAVFGHSFFGINFGNGLTANSTTNTVSVLAATPSNLTVSSSGVDLTPTGILPGTFNSVIVDSYGRITGGSNSSINAEGSALVPITNNSGLTLLVGEPIYVNNSGIFTLANNTLTPPISVLGLLLNASLSPNQTGQVVTAGTLTATLANWTTLTGESNGLTPGSWYYLGTFNGSTINTLLTKVAPTTGTLLPLGLAVSNTSFLVQIGTPVVLM